MNKVENSSNPFSKIISAYNIFNFLLIGLIFLIDRISKIKIINYQSNTNSIYINDYLNFELVWNTGIGFGLFNLEAGLTYHIITFFIFIIIAIIFFVIIKSDKVDKFLFSILLGGALGNLYDRIFYFAVPDFIDLHIGNYHWFTFNIADIFISVAIIFLLIKELAVKKW